MKPENMLAPGIKAIGLALWIPKEKSLVISDLHLGYEEMLNRQGIMMPRINFSEITEKLEKIFLEIFKKKKQAKIEKIIINGDLKHEFGEISQQEWKETLDMLEFLEKNCSQIILVQGNHDKILGPIAKFKKMRISKEGFFLEKSKILVVHGNEIPKTEEFKKSKTIVIGHEHPAISLREAAKTETYKCFLKGKFEKKDLIVLPSMSAIAYGTDVLKQEILSPFLQQNLSEFEAWIIEDKVYYFGKIKNLEKNLGR
ncbi:MAG: metallophosphoesterase [Candidatus ainarchaeum sp.]|nr:metallophosphoesterase [Candidatus ainarchaeum sp.]